MESLAAVQPLTPLDQGHLGWKVIPLNHLNRLACPAEPDVFNSAVRRASHKPETVQRIEVLSRCSLAMKSEAREEIRGCSPAPVRQRKNNRQEIELWGTNATLHSVPTEPITGLRG